MRTESAVGSLHKSVTEPCLCEIKPERLRMNARITISPISGSAVMSFVKLILFIIGESNHQTNVLQEVFQRYLVFRQQDQKIVQIPFRINCRWFFSKWFLQYHKLHTLIHQML